MKDLSKSEAKIRIEKLKKVINRNRYLYHVLDKQEMSDAANDSLKKELWNLEQKFPDLRTDDSPTERVGGDPLKKFKKVAHKERMLSLEDVFSKEEVEEWFGRLKKHLGRDIKPDFYCDLKMDGLAVELFYENGLLIQASTRGDGTTGEDITTNAKTIEAIPLRLEDGAPSKLTVRGEIYITKKEFDRVNQEQKKKGGKIYANQRNIAAGSVRQLNPKITASRKLRFYSYGIWGRDTDYLKKYKKRSDEYKALHEFGIPTNPYGKVVHSIKEMNFFYEGIAKKRERLDYEIDGIVVSINDNGIHNEAGVVGKAPRGATAYKFEAKEATTVVENIIVQVGRTGVLTPVAILRPVNIGGATVSRATLHNEDEIERLGVKIGDTVIVGRAGDVIPDVKSVVKGMRTGGEKKFHMLSACPVCGELVQKKEGEVQTRCVNKKCPAKKREQLYHFVSRGAFDIEGLGPKIIDAFLDNSLIQDAADIFDLKEGDIAPLERFGEKSAENIIKAIDEKRSISLPRFLYSLGILHVGEETAIDLAENFGSLEKIKNASLENLSNVENIGGVVAESVYSWFHDDHNERLLKKLFNKIKVKNHPKKKAGKLTGKTFVFTGEMESLTRGEAKRMVRELGGDPSETVSKNTDFVVVGANPGSKYEKAQKLGVKIINEKEFRKLIS